jgi:hypothetical protein
MTRQQEHEGGIEKQSAVARRTPYGLLTVLRDASPQVAPSFDYGSPFFTRSLLCISTGGKAMRQ